MKVTKTSKGVILTVSDFDELLELNGVKYYENKRTKLSSEIYEIKVDGLLEIDDDERDYINSLSDTSIPFTPETYDLTLYGKVIGNLGLAAYDILPYNGGRSTLIKVNLTYPEAEKIESSIWPICGTLSFKPNDFPYSVKFEIFEDLRIWTSANNNPFESGCFHPFDKIEDGKNEIGVAWSPVGGWSPNDELFKIVFKNEERTEYDLEIVGNGGNLPSLTISKEENGSGKDTLWMNRHQLVSFKCPNLDVVPSDAFVYFDNLTSFSSENVKSIGVTAFYRSDLRKIYAPNVETIGQLAFCDTLVSEIDFPKVETLHVSSEDKTPFLHCPISSFKMDGLKYLINDEDKWFWDKYPGERYAWLREHGYVYSPAAIVTSYKEIEYLKGFNPLYQASGNGQLKTVSLKSYNCGTPIQSDFDYDTEYLYYPISRDLISGNYLENVEELNIQSMEKIPSGFSQHLKNVKDIVFNKDLKCVFDRGFEGCELLSGVISFDKLEYIGYRAFAGCKNITKAVLPNDIETIDSEAFAGCDNLASVEGAARVAFYGRRASDTGSDNIATNIFAGTKVKDLYYDDLACTPFQYKGLNEENPPPRDIFGIDANFHLKRSKEYQPLPEQVPGIVIHPFITAMNPFIQYEMKSSSDLGRRISVSVPMDIYLDYKLKCEGNKYLPGFDPSFNETMVTLNTIREIINRGGPSTDQERTLVQHKEELETYSWAMEFVHDNFDKFIIEQEPGEGGDLFELSSVITPTVITYGKDVLSRFETNKKEFIDFVPSFIEFYEENPATEPVLSVGRIYDDDFVNKSTNFDFLVVDTGNKALSVDLTATVSDFETGKEVWKDTALYGYTSGQTLRLVSFNQESGKQYTVTLAGKNTRGLVSYVSKNYKATAYSSGSLKYIKAISDGTSKIRASFVLSKLPTDANGREFNPNVELELQDESNKTLKKVTFDSVGKNEEKQYVFSVSKNNKNYYVKVTVKGRTTAYDATSSIKFYHKVTKKLCFKNHYTVEQWGFNGNTSSFKTVDAVIGEPFNIQNYSSFGYSLKKGTTFSGFTRTANKLTPDYKTTITVTESDPDTIVLYPVPNRIWVAYSENSAFRTSGNINVSTTTKSGTHGNGGFSAIYTGLPQSRNWKVRKCSVSISNVNKLNISGDMRDNNGYPKKPGNDWCYFGGDDAIVKAVNGVINGLWWAYNAKGNGDKRNCGAWATIRFDLIGGVYTFLNPETSSQKF